MKLLHLLAALILCLLTGCSAPGRPMRDVLREGGEPVNAVPIPLQGFAN